MGHGITVKDNLAYVGEKPWHGLGVEVADLLTANEALLKGGLTWRVIEAPIFNEVGQKIEGFKQIKREDTGDVFQVVTDRYLPVQNVDCFKIFDEVCGTGQAKYEVVGSLQSGRKVWILARLPYDFALANGRDEVRSYLLLTTSHDGSLAFQLFQTPIRVVCANTLRASLQTRQAGKVAYFKHTTNFRARVGQAQVILAEARQYFLRFKEASELLARKQLTELEIDSFLTRLFGAEGKKENEISTKTKNAISEVKRLIEYSPGNQIKGVRGTAWAAYNGVTYFIDHERATRGEDENRFASSQYGSGAEIREDAFRDLVTIARK